jgi:excisionase family DNA binding protein
MNTKQTHRGGLHKGREAHIKSRPTQFGARENSDSPRAHVLRRPGDRPFTSTKEFKESQDGENLPSSPSGNSTRLVEAELVTNRFEPLLDVVEAAGLLRMHPRTLRAKARKQLIPAIQVGRRWRFRASTLNTWLEGLPS